MDDQTYECAICHQVFTKAATEEEAEKELAENFPGVSKADCGIVCDDCYNKLFN